MRPCGLKSGIIPRVLWRWTIFPLVGLAVAGCLTPSNFETPTPPGRVVLTSTFTPALALTPFPTAEGPLQDESPSAPGTETATLASPALATSILLPEAKVA